MVVAGAFLCASCGGDNLEPLDSRPRQDVRLALDSYFRDLVTLRVATDHDSLRLLFDTGGGATLITPAVAAAHRCDPHGADVGHRMTGELVTFARCDSLRMRAGGWNVLLAPIAVFDVNALLPRPLPPLDGVLALDAFAGRVITIDLAHRLLTVHGSMSEDSAAAANGVDFRMGTGASGRFLSVLLPVTGIRGVLWFLLDSGNLRGTLVGRSVARDSLLHLVAERTARIATRGQPVFETSFDVEELLIDGALGTDFLMRAPVTLDLRPARPAR